MKGKEESKSKFYSILDYGLVYLATLLICIKILGTSVEAIITSIFFSLFFIIGIKKSIKEREEHE